MLSQNDLLITMKELNGTRTQRKNKNDRINQIAKNSHENRIVQENRMQTNGQARKDEIIVIAAVMIANSTQDQAIKKKELKTISTSSGLNRKRKTAISPPPINIINLLQKETVELMKKSDDDFDVEDALAKLKNNNIESLNF